MKDPDLKRRTHHAMFASLKVRNFRLFFLGQLVSLTGAWAQIIAQDWLILDLTNNSATALGTVTALQFIPVLLFTLYAGLLADRFDKRRMLIIVMVGMMVACLVMGAIVTAGLAQVWHVYLFAVVTGVGNAFEKPIRQAFLPEMVGQDLLRNAVSLNSATFNATRLIGPAVGGLAIAAFGTGPTFLINAISYIGVITGLVVMRVADISRAAPAIREPGQLVEGLRFVWRRKDLLLIGAMGLVVGAFAMNLNLMLSLRARVDFAVDAAHLGILSSALAIGALAGALWSSATKSQPRAGRQLLFAAGFGLATLGLAATPSYWLTMAALVPVGALLIGHNTLAQARLQLGTPARLRGRVLSLYMLVFFGAAPAGAALLGPVADAYGARTGFAVIGVGVLAATIALWLARSYRHGARLLLVAAPRPHLKIVRSNMSVIRVPGVLPKIAR